MKVYHIVYYKRAPSVHSEVENEVFYRANGFKLGDVAQSMVIRDGMNDTMRYFLCPGKTDMRKGINSLCGLVHDKMGYDVRLGDVFIFVNRSRRGRHRYLIRRTTEDRRTQSRHTHTV